MISASAALSDTVTKLPQFPQLNGIFALNKLAGPSSAQCLKIFKKLGQKKIGHAGTLDPFASGVLLVLLGHATKLADYLHEGDRKIYQGIIRLGRETDTWDSTGVILADRPPEMEKDAVHAGIMEWESLQEQPIPPYSAAKHNGKCFYELARKGQTVPQKLKKIEIFRAQLLEFNAPFATFRVFCGSGVYMRSLAHSLGKRLGCGACLEKLTREYSYPFDIAQAVTLADLEKEPEILLQKLVPCQDALPDWQKINLSAADSLLARQGHQIPAKACLPQGTRSFLLQQNEVIALAELVYSAGAPFWRIKRGLWNNP